MPPRKAAAGTKTTTAVKKEGATKKRTTTKKEKSGVKRPMSAFFHFSMKRRREIVAATPALRSKVTEVGRMLGTEWKSMNEAQKAPYVKLNEDDKKRYEAEKTRMGL